MSTCVTPVVFSASSTAARIRTPTCASRATPGPRTSGHGKGVWYPSGAEAQENPTPADVRVARLAALQHDVISARQLYACDLGAHMEKAHLRGPFPGGEILLCGSVVV